ncbi:MAG: riboflavin synthase [Bacteroidota bacterium]|nr:riboflavin synthase [Bacteroidota bacterium]
MFTGIITEIGRVESIQRKGKGVVLQINAPASSKELKIDDSVSINGACQTVVAKSKNSFEVVAVEETLKKTTLGNLKSGEQVNLELAMRLSDRLGGHLVLGHIDCVGKIKTIEQRTVSLLLTVVLPKEFMKYVIPVGSVAIDGVSLTVADVGENSLNVSIIPHTMENTIFRNKKINDIVNIEFDVLGKYVETILTKTQKEDGKEKLTVKKLRSLGY